MRIFVAKDVSLSTDSRLFSGIERFPRFQTNKYADSFCTQRMGAKQQ